MTLNFVSELGCRIHIIPSAEDRAGSFLFQQISVAIQRYNSVNDTLVANFPIHSRICIRSVSVYLFTKQAGNTHE